MGPWTWISAGLLIFLISDEGSSLERVCLANIFA